MALTGNGQITFELSQKDLDSKSNDELLAMSSQTKYTVEIRLKVLCELVKRQNAELCGAVLRDDGAKASAALSANVEDHGRRGSDVP